MGSWFRWRSALLAAWVVWAPVLWGQSSSTEEQFQDLFVTAGYSTAFGAALGLALLSFSSDPSSELSTIAVGASLGFIGGSLLGTYMILAPSFVFHPGPSQSLALVPDPQPDGRVGAAAAWTWSLGGIP